MRVLGLFIFVLGVAGPASAFEGVLHQTTTIAQIPPIPSDVSLRENGDTRTDSVVPGTGESLTVIHRAGGATITLMHAKKAYSEAPAQADSPPPPGAAEMLKSLQLKVIGDEQVAGHACKHVQLIQDKDTTIDVWMAGDMGAPPDTVRKQGIASGMFDMLDKNGVKGFPLKMKATHLGQSLTLETTRVEPKKLDPATFEVPKSYTKI